MTETRGSAPPPLIIWTLQRTGGTNLTQRMVEHYGLNGTQHEPFNPKRRYGELTTQWMANRNATALARAVLDVVALRWTIKHCVEMVPWPVSQALATATVQAGYRHLFLYRARARDRLLSLHFAKQTGIWGPDMRDGEAPAPERSEAVPVEQMVRHEEMCVGRLQQAWHLLQRQGARPVALAYEEVYGADRQAAEARLKPVLGMLGLSRSPEDDQAFVAEVLAKGDQHTRDRYGSIPGAEELERALHGVARFAPDGLASPFAAERLPGPAWVARLQVDSLPEFLPPDGRYCVGGVLVIGADAPDGLELCLGGPDGPVPVEWGIASQEMGRLYPQARNGACSRFLSADIAAVAGTVLSLDARDAAGTVYPLLRVKVNAFAGASGQ